MAANNLTRDEARRRAELIQTPLYEISLDLTQDTDTFACEATIHFLCKEPGAESFIDFLAPSLDSCELNGEEVPRQAFNGERITLSNLRDANELHVIGTCEYGNIGAGLSKFKDPVDHKIYLHSQFETFNAHRMFPCFDQPDLKATFTFTVLAPSDWIVVSNNPGQAQQVAGRENIKRWTFGASPKMSSYLTAIIAGPYHGVRDRHGDIDLGIFCRQSLAQYLDAQEIFTITKQGLDFYGEAYKYPYPFQKYDQLFVPEFSAGAMENVGAVTFNEFMVFRSKVTEAVREDRANTILHEMAHMWFGDLVTMRWWDDLWLNESFATFMSVLCQVDATRFKNGWVTFANQYKAGARRQDQLPTTHPIAADVPDIESVYLNFDAITYNKGACVLRQLVAYVGQDTFLRGVQRYVKQRAYSNATLADFLSDIESGSGRDLKAWSKLWLETAGLNTLRPVAQSQSDTIGSLTIRQEAPPEHPFIRPHRLAVGLYDRQAAALDLRRRVELDVVEEQTPVGDLAGEKLADLLLVNDLDLTYAKIRLDEHSLTTAVEHLKELTDPLARAITWAALWDMLRDAELPARRYLPLILNNIQGETDIGVVQDLLGQASSAIWVYGDPTNADSALTTLADHALRALDAAGPGTDLQLAWTHSFIGAARSDAHVSVLKGLLDGIKVFTGLKVDTDVRWAIVSALAGVGADDGLIDAELQRDPTDEGQRHAAAARASRPTSESKEQTWTTIIEDRTLPLATLRSTMAGFSRFDQRRLLEPYAARYFQVLPSVWKDRDIEVALAIGRMMFPTVVVGEETITAIDQYLSGEDVPGPIRRILLEGKDNMQRAMRGRAVDAAAETVAAQR
ncbi:MAG TPA: aminopeptidase N [Candidatus Dormibacteraeota bacterium]|nr:aminopeptidase N [Candidatus Dormibacteraeota bacterium]